MRFTQWALRPDSAGAGMHRGGLGAVYEIELLEQSAQAFLFGERGCFAPKGAAGGGKAALNRFGYENGGVWHAPPMVSKMVGIGLKRGERVRLETPGGGGYGLPENRDPAFVARDVAMGYLTAEAADRDYGIAWREGQP